MVEGSFVVEEEVVSGALHLKNSVAEQDKVTRVHAKIRSVVATLQPKSCSLHRPPNMHQNFT